MAETRLDSLSYRVVSREPDRWDLSELQHQSFALDDFDCTITSQVLEARPRRDFSDEEAGRAALEPKLDQWEAVIELESQVAVRFGFVGSSVSMMEDVDAVGNAIKRVSGAVTLRTSVRGSAKTTLRSLPPPSPFVEPSSLRVLRERIREYRLGHERLLVLGYFAYTTFTERYGGKGKAPLAMGVEPAILETLNELSSNRTHPQHGRKATRGRTLSDEEHYWVEVAVVELAKRMGEIEAKEAVPPLTMADLPSLR